MKAIELLKPFNPCSDAIAWLSDKDINEAWNTCPRGDWMLWAYTNLHPEDIRGRVAVAAECAATVKHLLTDPRSIAAIEAARAFGRGEIDAATLKSAAEAAAEAAADATARAAAWAAAWAATWAARAARAARAAEVAALVAALAAALAAARDESALNMANICRRMLKL